MTRAQQEQSKNALKVALEDELTKGRTPSVASTSLPPLSLKILLPKSEKVKQLLENARLENVALTQALTVMRIERDQALQSSKGKAPLKPSIKIAPVRPKKHILDFSGLDDPRHSQEQDPLESGWQTAKSTTSWYHDEIQENIRKCNEKVYQFERHMYDLAHRLWPVTDFKLEIELPTYMIRAKVRQLQDTSEFFQHNKDIAKLANYNRVISPYNIYLNF